MANDTPDFGVMLNQVLDNPEAMKTISQLAGSLMNKSEGDSEHTENAEHNEHNEHNDHVTEARPHREDENHIRLLIALKPYLNESRREKVDMVLKVMKLMQIANISDINGLMKKLNIV